MVKIKNFRWISKINWSSLGSIGFSPITRIISVTPIVSVYIYSIRSLPVEFVDLSNTRFISVFIGLFLFGTGSIVFNLACPRFIKNYPNPIEFIKLYDLITPEGYIAFQRYLRLQRRTIKSPLNIWNLPAKLSTSMARADEGFIEDAFLSCCAERNQNSIFDPDKVSVIRILWYYHIFNNQGRSVARMLVTLLFIVGAIFIIVPSVTTLTEAARLYFEQILYN